MAAGGFEGMEELIRDIQALGEGGAAAAEKGLLRGASEIVGLAKGNTPVRTGRARRSIHVGGHPELSGDFNPGADRGWYGDVGNYAGSEGSQRAVEVGSDLFYFGILEEGGAIGGNRPRRKGKRGQAGKGRRTMPARRMLGNAVDAMEGRVEQYVAEAVGELAAKVGL